MKWIGNIEELAKGIHIMDEANSNMLVEVEKCEIGFTVSRDGERCFISYNEKCDFFRAFAILRYKIQNNETDFVVCQYNRFNTCGIMLDVSRNAVLKTDTVKEIIRYMANMGLNMFMLYTEDTYKMEEYPYFGYMRGAYTKEEIKEIVEYADIFGIEAVPNIQTLAHLEKALRWSWASDICDNMDTLLIGEEKTYDFIECMVKTCRECFKSKKIHIGMDEAEGVGLGEYLKKHGYRNRYELLSEHLNRVMDILRKYDFEPMMWSDMFFRLGSKGAESYDPDAQMPENISEIIPRDLSMVYWDYYSMDSKFYEDIIKIHQTMKRNVVFAGGAWTWSGPAVHHDKAYITTNLGLSACVKCGVKDVLVTMWGDDGAECSAYEALLILQQYAEYNYSEQPEQTLDEMFKICTGLDANAFRLLGIDTFDDELCPTHDGTVSKQVLYQDVLQGLFDKNFSAIDLKSHYKNISEKLKRLEKQGNLEYIFDYHRQLVKVLYQKCDVGIRLTDAYKNNDTEMLNVISNELLVLLDEIKKLHEMSADIWYKNNKAFGFQAIDFRLGGIEARIKRCKKRVSQYIKGEIAEIEELTEERLWYKGENKSVIQCYYCKNIFD